MRISHYADLNAVFYSQRTWGECILIGKTKETKSFNISSATWAAKAM